MALRVTSRTEGGIGNEWGAGYNGEKKIVLEKNLSQNNLYKMGRYRKYAGSTVMVFKIKILSPRIRMIIPKSRKGMRVERIDSSELL